MARSDADKRARQEIERRAAGDAGFAIAFAVLAVADANSAIARQLALLGTGNAATEMGAIEFLACEVKGVAEAISQLAGVVEDSR